MFARWKRFAPFILIILFSLFLFRSYFLNNLVPFPANLLVSYYEPWRSYPAPEYPNGPPNKAMGFDNVRIYYPLKTVALQALRQHMPPLWNPYNFAGSVLLGTYQSAVFHPFSWLFLVLPTIDAWSVMMILQPILCALAMYAFLTALKLSRSARFIGAVAFAFSGFFMTWWQESYLFTYSALFLPVALYAVERYLEKRDNRWLALLAASLTLSIFSGAFQMTFYVYMFTIVWILYRCLTRPDRWYLWFRLAGAAAISVLLGSVHLIPSMEAYAQSTRVSTDVKYIFDAYLLPFHQLVTLFAPDYFGNPATYNYFGKGFYHERLMFLGTVPFILILTQLLQWKSASRDGKFFRAAFLITLSLVLTLPTTWLVLYYLRLPLLSTMTPSRMMMLVSFTGAVLSAYAVEQYWKALPKKILLWVSIISLLALGAAGAAPLAAKHFDDKNTSYVISLRNLVIPGISIFITVFTLWVVHFYKNWKPLGLAIVAITLMGNAFFFTNKYLYFSERRFVYPYSAVFDELKKKQFDRFWTYDNGYIEKNFASQYSMFSPEGYDSIMIKRYGELLAFANSGGGTMVPDRANALIRSTDHFTDILTDPYRRRTLELLGARYIARKLTPDKNEQKMQDDPAALPRIWEDGTYAIHEYHAILPRVHLFTDVQIETNGTNLLESLYNPSTDIKKTVFLEESPGMSYTVGATGSASITAYTPNTVTVRTQTDGAMLLHLSDAYYPGWNAYVDGKKTKVYRANYTFRAVTIPDGNHEVVFRYEPLSWLLGIGGSLAGVLLCGVLMRLNKKIG